MTANCTTNQHLKRHNSVIVAILCAFMRIQWCAIKCTPKFVNSRESQPFR